MTTELKGYVLKILSPSEVIINLGKEHGVERGMRFIIYEEGEMICDPNTKEPIEKLELVKGEVKVIHVQQKISIAKSLVKEKRPVLDPLFPLRYKEEIVEVEKQLENVKVGDLVRRIE